MTSRTPEFRTWHKNKLKYAPKDVAVFYFDGLPWDKKVEEESGILMWGVGSTDSTQKPIYEGDIVLWHAEDHFEGGYSYKKMVVGWNQRCMQFRLYEFPNQVGKSAGETFWAEDVRVIGHIFDYENEECWYHLDESVKSLRKQHE